MSSTTQADPPAEATGGHRHLGWALVLICVAQLMVVLDATIANIALPYIQADLHFSQANLTWIVTGYSLAFGGLLLLGGRLGDLYGRRRIFMIGLALFAVASLVGGVAQSEAMLLAARGFQGFGAALASPAALALITTTFPAGPSRTRAFGVYAAMSGAGAAVGLLLGGWLTGIHNLSIFGADLDGWRLTFLINVPIGILAALAAPRLLAESESHSGELDIPGAITGTLGLLGIVFGLSRAGESDYGWGNWQTITSLVAGVVLLVAFIFIETRVKHPLLPMRIFANQTRASSFVAFMIAPAAMFAMFFFLSLYVQNIMGYSPIKAGLAFLPFSFGVVAGATVTQQLVTRLNPRFIAGIGTLLATVALFGFSRLSVDDSAAGVLKAVTTGQDIGSDVNYWTSIFPFVVIMSFGMGLTFVTLTLTAVHHVEARDSGIGSGVLNTMQQVGGALGLAVLSTVSTHFATQHADKIGGAIAQAGSQAGLSDSQVAQVVSLGSFPSGATHAFVVGGFLMLAASLVVWLFLNVKKEELATDGPEGGMHVG
jgi:EmrB/QacA subfamily drug resistance transporter